MHKKLLTSSIIALCFLDLFSVRAQDKSLTSKLHNKKDTINANITNFKDLPENVKYFVNRRRTNAQFGEDIAGAVPLSKASFLTNKRWMTKSEFSERKSFVLDAKISPYINISSFNWNIGTGNKAGYFLFSLYFNPDFEVRIFQNDKLVGDSSLPVRTASFKPGGELFISHSSFYHKDRNRNFAFSLKGYHHSNGQDGPEFNKVDQLWGKRGYFNTYNGNFSDDFVIETNLMMFYKNWRDTKRYFLKLGLSNSTFTTEGIKQYNIYGTQRVNLMASFISLPKYSFSIRDPKDNQRYVVMNDYHVERLRVEFYAGYITNPMNVGPIHHLKKASFEDRINAHLTTHFRLPGFTAAGLFVESGYYGQDTYNAYFQRSGWFNKFGISFGLFKYPKKPDELL